MKLTPRLKTIANFVVAGERVADIGTDHGYLPVYLVEKKISNQIIAADINEGPLLSAKSIIEKTNYQDIIKLRLGSGIEVLQPGEVDTVIIAGMGGVLISEILGQDLEKSYSYGKFILQPMVAQDDLRRYLYANGFNIVDEKLAREGEKYYEIMVVEKGESSVEDDIYFEVSPHWFRNKDDLLLEYLDFKIEKLEKIYKKILLNSQNEAIASEFEQRLKKIKELRK